VRTLTAVALLLFIIFAIAALPAAAQPAFGNTTTYRVRPGDTLWSLARRFGTTPDRLTVLNGISTEATLQIGRPLRVPVASGPVPSAARAAALARTPATTVYQLQAGDTLWRISRRYNTTPERLAALNGITGEAILQIGLPLRVPHLTAQPRVVVPLPSVQGAQSAATPDPAVPGAAEPNPAAPDQDPATVQDLPAPDPGTQPPAPEPGAPATPARDPSGSDPRPRIIRLPSRGAQWMTTIVALSKRYLGAPYRWGGASPNGFDCSGFLNYVFEQTGIDLPRTTFAMFAAGTPVPNEQLQAGDVLFFQTVGPGPSHAGVYLGDGRFIHTSSGQRRVTIATMADPYYTARYLGARRY
jgi:D-gamma-glutamyl-meso-diaminopimelic acid endopeptidase CwlS/peptidoglycan endopeptidase LytE